MRSLHAGLGMKDRHLVSVSWSESTKLLSSAFHFESTPLWYALLILISVPTWPGCRITVFILLQCHPARVLDSRMSTPLSESPYDGEQKRETGVFIILILIFSCILRWHGANCITRKWSRLVRIFCLPLHFNRSYSLHGLSSHFTDKSEWVKALNALFYSYQSSCNVCWVLMFFEDVPIRPFGLAEMRP